MACSQWTTPLKVYDDPTVLGLCLALLLLSETAREMVAKAQNVALGARRAVVASTWVSVVGIVYLTALHG